jgi:3-oxosteroid 1-dehydrogenase
MKTIIVGSGAAGLAAAIGAAREGGDVTVLECAERIGGTTAISAGAAWLPCHHLTRHADSTDSPARAHEYLTTLARGWVDADSLRAFTTDAPRVAESLESHTPLRWKMLPYPDYYVEHPGAAASGRTIEPHPLNLDAATAHIEDLVHRGGPGDLGTSASTYGETLDGRFEPDQPDQPEQVMTMGRALIGGLAIGAEHLGVTICPGVRAQALVRDHAGTVTGVQTANGTVNGRVILATGGFERDPGLVRRFLPGPIGAPLGVATTTGDGLRMAMNVSADLANMCEAWWCPAYRIPGETSGPDAPRHRILFPHQRAAPGSVIVDQSGRRFANEAQNYNDLGRTLRELRPGDHAYSRSPSWLVFDATYRSVYADFLPLGSDPDWCHRAQDLHFLAAAIAVDAEVLTATLQRFNDSARDGQDPDFHRGQYAYDRYQGDHGAPFPNLAPIATPPYYALAVLPGILGTKGGPRTDDRGRVQRADGSGHIPGLYAAGNAAASPLGTLYPGGGGTIGPALVYGTRAGEAAATDA